jgi:hypothetical protein
MPEGMGISEVLMIYNQGALTLYTGGAAHQNVFDSGAGDLQHPSYRSWGILRCLSAFAASFMRRDLRALAGSDRDDVIERHKPAEFMGFALMEALANYDTVAGWALERGMGIQQGLQMYDTVIACGELDG